MENCVVKLFGRDILRPFRAVETPVAGSGRRLLAHIAAFLTRSCPKARSKPMLAASARVEPDEILVDRRAMASTVGLRLANAYHPQMWEIPRHGRSAVDCFLDDRRLRRTLEKAARFYPNRALLERAMSPQCLAIPASIAGFKLSAGGRAVALYQRFSPEGGRLLDFSAGFGGRLLGQLT